MSARAQAYPTGIHEFNKQLLSALAAGEARWEARAKPQPGGGATNSRHGKVTVTVTSFSPGRAYRFGRARTNTATTADSLTSTADRRSGGSLTPSAGRRCGATLEVEMAVGASSPLAASPLRSSSSADSIAMAAAEAPRRTARTRPAQTEAAAAAAAARIHWEKQARGP
jgi:hypothetical protein